MQITTYNDQGSHDVTTPNWNMLLASADVVWVDIAGPGDSDLELMRDVFHFHPLAIEDTVNQRQRPGGRCAGSAVDPVLFPPWRQPGRPDSDGHRGGSVAGTNGPRPADSHHRQGSSQRAGEPVGDGGL